MVIKSLQYFFTSAKWDKLDRRWGVLLPHCLMYWTSMLLSQWAKSLSFIRTIAIKVVHMQLQSQTEAASFSLPYNMFPNAEWRSNTLDVSQWRLIWQGLKNYDNIQKIPFASTLESLSVKLLRGTEDLLSFPHGSIRLQTSYISWFLCSLL